MNISIRKADIDDIDILVEWRMVVLNDVFSEYQKSSFKDLEENSREYYRKAIPGGQHIACFAYLDDEIVGCGGLCLYSEMPSPDNKLGQCAYLMNIYVKPEFRSNNIGYEIVNWLLNVASNNNISKIFLETSNDGRRLYEKIGFKDMKDLMKFR